MGDESVGDGREDEEEKRRRCGENKGEGEEEAELVRMRRRGSRFGRNTMSCRKCN